MSRVKPYKFRELVKRLRAFDPRFEVWNARGKGSHRMLYHPNIKGRPESYPIICHGTNEEIGRHYIRDIIRRFDLPENVL